MFILLIPPPCEEHRDEGLLRGNDANAATVNVDGGRDLSRDEPRDEGLLHGDGANATPVQCDDNPGLQHDEVLAIAPVNVDGGRDFFQFGAGTHTHTQN